MSKVFRITEGLENMGALKTGGQGSVYKARRTGEIVTAVKLLPTPVSSESSSDKNYIDFKNEVDKLKKVNEDPNPNVVTILSSGITESGCFPFIEMQFIEGPDLEELLKPPYDPVFTVKEAIKLAEHLSNALAHCHNLDVKHGDIKSNNVKLNIHTGNYVLLDFGLSLMSDEERRTSLRHAGAIEFMAPEQNEGQMLFETDVYSFGVVLFEALAGIVPFPLKDKGQTARNTIMMAHLETPPPELIPLRQLHMPAGWSQEMKLREMNIPEWLVSLIYKCLEKKPENRFANGMELYEFILVNSALPVSGNDDNLEAIVRLQQENEQLAKENEELRRLLVTNGEGAVPVAPGSNYTSAATKYETLPHTSLDVSDSALTSYSRTGQSKKTTDRKKIFASIIAGLLVLILVYALVTKKTARSSDRSNATTTQPGKVQNVIGHYKVVSSRAYLYGSPDEDSKKSDYIIPSNDVITAYEDKNGFIYTEFTNYKGESLKGWLNKKNLTTLEDWSQRSKREKAEVQLTAEDIAMQLRDARKFLEKGQTKAALYIYSYLAGQSVPEAMYYYGNLALQNKNEDIDCGRGLEFVKDASDKGYTSAKRTLGFLYLFADNPGMLSANGYGQCEFNKNTRRGRDLLDEAIKEGDTTASHLLEQYQAGNPEQSSDH
ncbi:MAG: protein kinase [Chitinophagaceae bacterium]|nr:protein kinase [Chitinophagaceae bacterium]